ncbi:MAG: HEAT repeat domain-containing protein [Planctomycetaceae bacterium]
MQTAHVICEKQQPFGPQDVIRAKSDPLRQSVGARFESQRPQHGLRVLSALALSLALFAGLVPRYVFAQQDANSAAREASVDYGSDAHVRLLQAIYSNDVNVRIRLVKQLAAYPIPIRSKLLLKLTSDADPRVQIAAIDAARRVRPSPEFRSRIAILAKSHPDLIVREYASLLDAEWRLGRLPKSRQGTSDSASRVGPPTDSDASDIVPVNWDRAFQVPPAPASEDVAPAVSSAVGGASDAAVARFEDSIRSYMGGNSRAPVAKNPISEQQPDVLRSPLLTHPADVEEPVLELTESNEYLTPLGFTGPSSVVPTESRESAHFVPVFDRWRAGFPDWNRLENPDDPQDNYPYTKGHWWDPYNQNVLKGDYPIIGQHTFLNITATSQMIHEYRETPIPTTPFESTINPFEEEFFGDPGQYFYTHFLGLSVDLFHGNTAFKPVDWRLRVTPIFNMNYLDVQELGVVNPDVRQGTTRFRKFMALEEWFVEAKLADIGTDYDFISVRAGSQPVVSDFRGFILSDVNRGVRLFGTLHQNREQFNLFLLDQTEKDTNSQLNTFEDRNQNTVVLNYFRQDTFVLGYTLSGSYHYNKDQPSTRFDDNDFLVRPDPTGVYQPHEVEAHYLGVAGDGHFGLLNISHAFYHVEGSDSLNPLGGEQSDINANMAAVELSVDRDWVRFRASYFWASGDDDPNDGKAEGFDSILDFPNFAGGEFSYWNRQEIRLFGAGLTQRLSLVPDLRGSKTQGQSNFVNPGLQIVNLGMDFEITPKLKAITNTNFLWFDETAVLEQFVFQSDIDPQIGTDLSLGLEYRPLLNDNVQLIGGVSMLIPESGFDDLYGVTSSFTLDNTSVSDAPNLYAAFVDVILTY